MACRKPEFARREIFGTELNNNNNPVQEQALGDLAVVQAPTINEGEETDTSIKKDVTPITSNESIYTTYFDHPVQIHHYTWITTNAVGTKLGVTSDVVQNYFDFAPTNLRGKWAGSRYFTGDLKIRAVVQGYSFSQGMLILSFDPSPNLPEVTQERIQLDPRLCRSQVIPHMLIDPSRSDAYEISLPCDTVTGYWDIDAFNAGSYRMQALVLNNLGSGNATPSPPVYVCVYAYFENVKLHGYTTVSGKTGVVAKNFSAQEVEKPTNLSTMAHTVSNVTSKLSSFPMIGAAATTTSAIAGAAANVLESLGFSKPTVIDRMPIVNNRFWGDLSHVDGKDETVVLSSQHANAIAIGDDAMTFGSNLELSIPYMCERWGFAKLSTITTTMVPDSLVTSFKVSPFREVGDDGDVPGVDSTTMELPPVAHMASLFKYWRGNVKYKFVFNCSAFHRATVIIIHDTAPGVNPSIANAVGTVKSQVVQIAGRTEVDFVAEYHQPYPMMAVQHQDGLYQNGNVSVRVVNPVTTSGSMDPIWVNTYISMEEATFAFPTLEYWNKNGGFDNDGVLKVAHTTVSGMTNVTATVMGERVDSLKELCTKQATTRSITLGAKDNVRLNQPCMQPFPGFYGSVSAPNTWWTYYTAVSVGFVGWKGTTRHCGYRLNRGQNDLSVHGYLAPFWLRQHSDYTTSTNTVEQYAQTASYFNAITFAMFSHHLGIEGLVPYYEPSLFIPNYSVGGVDSAGGTFLGYQMLLSAEETNGMEYLLMDSGGDDFVPVYYRGVSLNNPNFNPTFSRVSTTIN